MHPLNIFSYLAFDFDSTLVTIDVDWSHVRRDLLSWLQDNYQFNGEPYRIHQMIDVAAEQHGSHVKEQAQRLMEQHEKDCSFTVNYPLVDYLLQTQQPWAILSNNCTSTIKRILEELKLKPSLTLAFEDVTHFKPHPEGIRAILDHFASPASDLIFSGDKVTDKQAAEACQVPFVFVQDLPQETNSCP